MIRVEIEASAERDLDNLDPVIVRKVCDKLQDLESHPEPHKWLKKLKDYKDFYRLHIGKDWVAVGQLESSMFRVRRIGHRSEVYKLIER